MFYCVKLKYNTSANYNLSSRLDERRLSAGGAGAAVGLFGCHENDLRVLNYALRWWLMAVSHPLFINPCSADDGLVATCISGISVLVKDSLYCVNDNYIFRLTEETLQVGECHHIYGELLFLGGLPGH